MQRRLLLVSVSFLVILVLLLGACTQAMPTSTATVQPATTTPTTATPTSTTATVKPATTTPTTAKPTTTTPTEINKTGGTLRMVWSNTTATFGYPLTSSSVGLFLGGFAAETLIAGTDTPQTYTPLLATSWELSPDKKSYTFHLKQGVKFSDGTNFNAAAVKWNIDNFIKANRAEVAGVTSADVIDEYTIRFNLSSWNSLVLLSFTRGPTQIVSPSAFQKNGQAWAEQNPIGTGPWVFDRYEQSQYVRFVRNPNYWRPGLPYLDNIEVITIKDPMTRQAMLLNGDAEGARELDWVSGKTLVDSGKFIYEPGPQGAFQITYNNTDPTSAWSKKEMRMALEYAIDKQTICDSLGKGFIVPSYENINGIWEVPNNKQITTPRKYDPVKAAQLIKDAGYPNGLKTSMELDITYNSDVVPAIQAQLAKVGINVEINVVQSAVYQKLLLEVPFPNVLRYARARGGPPEVLVAVNEDLATTSIKFPGLKRPVGWDTMLAQAMQESDPAKQISILNQMEQKAYDDCMFVPVYLGRDVNVWSKKLKNDKGPIFYSGGYGQQILYTYFAK